MKGDNKKYKLIIHKVKSVNKNKFQNYNLLKTFKTKDNLKYKNY